MFGFGPRLTTVFASRWKALLWSAGILLTAYCTVPSAEETAQKEAAHAAAAHPAAVHHKSPWARN
ncbi:MAG: hypothetical protein RL702_187 [Pseudomonadota bacterium]|jgi:hypothetical protein|nr:hypothetical protein [Novosphingobium sp.]HOA47912.1 hypothetical protein [Novosphingobium sp.]HPZ45547.1 hypothetical protein [Novosphingobium sp.]HQD99457.1 hypothetical protein [Novosphingobium sp.]